MTQIPKDPAMLFSYINTQLRDFYPDIEELCKSLSLEKEALDKSLNSIGYEYDEEKTSMSDVF